MQRVSFDHRHVEAKDSAVVMKRSAAFVLVVPAHDSDTAGRVHGDNAVALAGEAVAEAEVSLFGFTDQFGKFFDLLHGESCDLAGPFRAAGLQVLFQLCRCVGVFFHVGAVGIAITEQDMHDGAGERSVGARFQDKADVCLFHGLGLIDVDDNDLGLAGFAGLDGVCHDVDLRRHRVCSPDHHSVGKCHFARVRPSELAGACDVACPRHVGAEGLVHARVAFGVAQAVDAVALNKTHGAGEEVRPDSLRAVLLFRFQELF
ncbi:hypothetical protein PJE062_4161 [Pseudovibrio sp. JE062]|nr:hypothetical protein PJE062_4161 [Pseudovibrio sp. JE062]